MNNRKPATPGATTTFLLILPVFMLGACMDWSATHPCKSDGECSEGRVCDLSLGYCVPKPDDAGDAGLHGDTGITDSGYDAGADVSYPSDGSADASLDAGYDAGYDAGTCTPVTPVVDCQDYGILGWQCTVQAGCFMMGCNSVVDTECDISEYPDHVVTVSAFKIDKYEVTVSQYKACNTASPSTCTAPNTGGQCNWGVSGRESHPINCVDWNQAIPYPKS